jgi:hypothetical protein
MLTKSYVRSLYGLRDHNVQSQRKSLFPLCPRGIVVFWRPKNPFLAVNKIDRLQPFMRGPVC